MKIKKGITLITLVVTIIVLLTLVAVTISFTLGEDGIIERAKDSRLESRYGTIMDKVKVRENALEIAFARNQEGEYQGDFIEKLKTEGLITKDDDYDNVAYRTIHLGLQKDGTYKYTINIVDGSKEGQQIADDINKLPDAEVNKEYKNMTLIIETSSDEEVILPISNTEGLLINWNAVNNPDIFENPNNTMNPTNTYETEGIYEIQIKGSSVNNTAFGEDNNYYNPNIVGIKYWGENGFSKINSFGGYFQGEIPLPSRNSFVNVTSFNYIFSATYITKLPERFFANCPLVTTFADTFYGCYHLEGKIPAELFANCSLVTNFDNTFTYCGSLIGISKELFANCPLVTNFTDTFAYCGGLREIPAELFANCPLVTTFLGTFYVCMGLTKIPEGLFANCLNVTNFNSTFYYCSSLTGKAPDLWNRTGVTGTGCFYNCTQLTNFLSIPMDWKKKY